MSHFFNKKEKASLIHVGNLVTYPNNRLSARKPFYAYGRF